MKLASKNKKLGMKLLSKALNFTKGFPFAAKYSGMGHILMFHRVVPNIAERRIWSNSFLEVTTDYLEKVILYYQKHNYEFVSLDEALLYLKGEKKTSQKFVHFTFDDGYKDNLEFALPILKKHNVPATIYITADFPNKKAILWWYGVEEYVLENDSITFNFEGKHFELESKTLQEKNTAFGVIHHCIQNTDIKSLSERIDEMLEQFGLDKMKYVNNLALSWNDLRTLSEEPIITLGAHTRTHPNLGQLNPDKTYQEIVPPRIEMEEELNTKILHFAYPFGGKDQISHHAIDILKEANFESAVTTVSANVISEFENHLFELPRIAIGMSMDESTLDLIRHGFIPFIRNKGKKINLI